MQEKTHQMSKLREESMDNIKQIEQNERALNHEYMKLLELRYQLKEKRRQYNDCEEQTHQVMKIVNLCVLSKL